MALPINPRMARVWNYLNTGEDFYPIRDWPAYLRASIMSSHRMNRQRFNLFFFLVANGLEPEVAGQWTLLYDVKDGVPLSMGYDYEAKRQVQQMIKQHNDGSLYRERKHIYSMASGKVELF